jgi:hypothetical protein
VLRVLRELIAEGAPQVLPGDINTRLRESGEPLGTWEVRGELSTLERSGEIVNDPRTGAWVLAAPGHKSQRRRGSA